MQVSNRDIDFLKLLSQQYSTISAAAKEIINLTAILNLPKGTEHFLSDIHGEDEAFSHVIRNCSGALRRKIDQEFSNSLTKKEKSALATLIYYPKRKLPLLLKKIDDKEEWFRITFFRLIRICRLVSSKYIRSKVRKALPTDFRYILEELLHEQEGIDNKQEYYSSIIDTIISTGQAEDFITALSELIKHMAIDWLHIIGDIYDRGPGAHHIMDTLLKYHNVDIQWGNHDILWMGAAAGSSACIANVLRNCLRYGNMQTLENGYGISLIPLASFAMEQYCDDPCLSFRIKGEAVNSYTENELMLMARMHKAITIIQLKIEGAIIQNRKSFNMNERLLLDKINLLNGTVKLSDGKIYNLNDLNFPTLDPENPYKLTDRELAVLEQLNTSFQTSSKLQEHVRFLYSNGSLYLCSNGNLLYHGCIAVDDNGEFKEFSFAGKTYRGKSFMDYIDMLVRQAYFSFDHSDDKKFAQDIVWYLWSGSMSPLFGKDKMTTFERYFIDDAASHTECKNPYYNFQDSEKLCCKILEEFGLNPDSGRIINGHVPVQVKKGESPVKAGGKLIVIDGGFAKAYQNQTGIAGYTLVYNSHGIMLCAHQPFESADKAILEEVDIHSDNRFIEKFHSRLRVRDTDLGKDIIQKIADLNALLNAYRSGAIKEQ
jgi:fructose-1,6-bisphosphatase-3